MHKKIISTVLAVCLSFSLAATAMATEAHPVPVDGTEYSEKITTRSAATSVSGIGALEATDEQMESSALESKPEVEDEALSIASLASADATWCYLDPFTYYAQLYNYSCGAACVRMALKYITGTSYAESTIRSGCSTTSSGTYLSDMKEYINDEQSSNPYVTKYGATKTTMKSNLYSGIVTWDAPPVVGLQESTSNGWAYNLSAHFVTIYSILSDKSEVALCDPWAGYVSSTSSYKWVDKSTDDLYTAYDAVNVGYMY